MMTVQELDKRIRHYIYQTFSQTAKPPTTADIATHFQIGISTAEDTLENLANAHQIALVAGTHSIWMAHPFSAIATNFTAEVAAKKYWGN